MAEIAESKGDSMKAPWFKKSGQIAFAIMIFIIFSGFPASADQSEPETAESVSNESPQFIAYYFYTSKRCASCYRLEEWAETVIKDHFKKAIESGELQWKTVNVEKPENEHFAKDFNLYTKSLVIVEQNDGETVRWKNLDKVWQLLRDKDKYFDYVTTETKAFMEKS
jgi:hypothetical protein